MLKKSKIKKNEKDVKKRGRPKKSKETEKINKINVDDKKIILEKPVKDLKNKEEEKKIDKKVDFLYAVGKRKMSIARVRYYKNNDRAIYINNKSLVEYFPYFEWQKIVSSPLELVNIKNYGRFSVIVRGGGKRGQAESIRHAISKILVNIDQNYRPILKKYKLLTRDSRIKERKKYGLKRARKAPQWQKR